MGTPRSVSASDDPTARDSTTRGAAAQVDWLVAYQERVSELVEGLDPDQTRDRSHSLRQLTAMTPPQHDAGAIETMAGEPAREPDPEPDSPDPESEPADRQRD
jgi:hypothetical protein